MTGLGQSCATLLKVAVMSGRPSKGGKNDGSEIVVLGNGPSLRGLLDGDRKFLAGKKLLCVNFAANTPEYFELRPDYYVLADPHFFNQESGDGNVRRLWENLQKTDWQLTLWLPCKTKLPPLAADAISSAGNVTVKRFNLTPGEGVKSLRHFFYRKGLAMPRPRNVLIPSLMIAMREGFKRIYVAGADHTWSKTLDVNSHNQVVSVQPHFYADSDKEQKRVDTEYAGYHLHDILKSLYTAFRSYHLIARYAGERGVEIINITPHSMIDAFERMSVE